MSLKVQVLPYQPTIKLELALVNLKFTINDIHVLWTRLTMVQMSISSGWHHLIHLSISIMHLRAIWTTQDHGFLTALPIWNGNTVITHSCGFMASVSKTWGFRILNNQFGSWLRKNNPLVSLLHFHILPFNTLKVQLWYKPFNNRLTINLLV